jgi:Neuraminidase (sialidase)
VGSVLNRLAFVATVFAVATLARAADEKSAGGAGAHGSHGGKSAVGVLSLDVCSLGPRVHLLIAERIAAGEPPVMRYLRSEDGGATWAAPVTVGEGQPGPDAAHRGLDAQIAASGDHLLAMWTTGATTRFGRGPLATAISDDGGKTWTPGSNPSDDGNDPGDHAFADVVADDAGTFHAVWLDGRGEQKSSDKSPGSAGGGKGLRYARSTDGGRSWSAVATLDAQCCECCWNSIIALPGNRVQILYRDRDPRDMALVSSTDGGKTWGKSTRVGAFDWAFTGCPHVGGALAAGDGNDAAKRFALVWTAKGGDAAGVFALASDDHGTTWSTPTQLGGPQSSRPDLARNGDGHLAAVWDAYVDDAAGHSGNRAFVARSTDDGKTWSTPTALSALDASATYPRVIPTVGGGFRVFWTEQPAGKPARWASQKVR